MALKHKNFKMQLKINKSEEKGCVFFVENEKLNVQYSDAKLIESRAWCQSSLKDNFVKK